jgi:class 3 adenylate cyclase
MSETRASDQTGRLSGGRKLIAVVHADMVGYSRLIGLDDVGTLERLRSLRSTLINPAIDEHGGRIVNTGGDSLLMVFDSTEGAVRCAVKVQQQVAAHDGDLPPDRAIRFRVGINVGDVIPDGSDVHGDVVNVAARLQAECPPGGICVSRAVRDHVADRLGLAFEELGPLKLKNIDRLIDAFVLQLHRNKNEQISKATFPPMRIDLNLQQLQLFYRVAKLGSIPRAAEELHIAQSSISGQLLEFEQRCGVALLHRSSAAGVALTDAGRLALDHAERIFSQAGELRSMLEHFPGARAGRLTVGGSFDCRRVFSSKCGPSIQRKLPRHCVDDFGR